MSIGDIVILLGVAVWAVIAVKRDATLAGSLIDALCKAGQRDDFIDPKDALPIISKRTLCIVVDTYQAGLVESKEILEKCGRVAVIDHHRKGVGYIQNPDLVCHEPYSSSASELVTELLQYVGERDDKPNRVEAEGLLSGMFADVTFHTAVSESAVVVPSEAILTSSDKQYVFIVENGAAKRVDITTGLTGSGMTEVTSGLDAGEQLVTVGQQYLSDGDAVRVVEG